MTLMSMFQLVASTIFPIVAINRNYRRIVGPSRPVSPAVRRLRAGLRDSPKTGRFRSGVLQELALTEDMMREVAASEGYSYTTSAKGTNYFEYVGRVGEEVLDA